jgi:NAD(P)H-nitrite reductase large subunit
VLTGVRVDAIEPAGGAAAAAPAPAPGGGGLLARVAAAVGLSHHHTATPPSASGSAAPLKIKLSNGQMLETDLVIIATGVRPAIGFLENSGIKCLVGVLTDEHLQTSVPGVYAAGDCAEAFDKVSEKTIVSAIQPNAAEQARVAALNMVGQPATLRGVTQINVLDTLGLISASFGQWQGLQGGLGVELTDKAAGRHLSLQFHGDHLVGCNAVGWTEHVGAMRGLVEGRVKLAPGWRDRLLDDPTRLMEAYLASAQAQEHKALVKA